MRIGAAIKRNIVVGILAVVGGFTGGALHDLIRQTPAIIRAGRFEVVEPSGRVASYWGPDADPYIKTQKGTLLTFLDPHGERRCQIGSRAGDFAPELLFYGTDGPSDELQRYNGQPRFSVGLGSTGSPILGMRGHDGDEMVLGAIYGERELGWGLSFRALEPSATAYIGYSRWSDGKYLSSIALSDGVGKHWESSVGSLKPLPMMKNRSQ